MSAVGVEVVVVLVILSKLTVTVCGSCVVPSLGNDELLVDTAPACFLVSDIVHRLPPELTTDNTTLGLVEY